MKNINTNSFKENRLVMVGDMEAPKEPEAMPTKPGTTTENIAEAGEAAESRVDEMVGKAESASELSESKEKQRDYCRRSHDTITRILLQLKKIGFKKVDDMEGYHQALRNVVPGMVRKLNTDKDNKKLTSHTLKQEGAAEVSKGGQNQKVDLDVMAKKLYDNYRQGGTETGGLACAEDLSDIPEIVADEYFTFSYFKKRTDTIISAFQSALTSAESVSKKYS